VLVENQTAFAERRYRSELARPWRAAVNSALKSKASSGPAAVPGSGYTKLCTTPKSSINRAESGAGAPRSKNFYSNPSHQRRRE